MVGLRQPVSLTYKQLLFFCKLVNQVTLDIKKPRQQAPHHIPVVPLIEIGLEALTKLGIKPELGASAKEYMEGKTTQMPMSTVLNVGSSRVCRRIGFGSKSIRYEV